MIDPCAKDNGYIFEYPYYVTNKPPPVFSYTLRDDHVQAPYPPALPSDLAHIPLKGWKIFWSRTRSVLFQRQKVKAYALVVFSVAFFVLMIHTLSVISLVQDPGLGVTLLFLPMAIVIFASVCISNYFFPDKMQVILQEGNEQLFHRHRLEVEYEGSESDIARIALRPIETNANENTTLDDCNPNCEELEVFV